MFLKKLYNYSKGLFIVFALFIVSFVYINLKWGVVAAPVFQYGMFSGKHERKDPQTIYTFIINGKKLNLASLSFEQRDLLTQQIELYSRYKEVNTMVSNVMLFTQQVITDKQWNALFRPNFNDEGFAQWVRNKVQFVTGYPVRSLEVYRQSFQYDGIFKPMSSKDKIMFIVS